MFLGLLASLDFHERVRQADESNDTVLRRAVHRVVGERLRLGCILRTTLA